MVHGIETAGTLTRKPDDGGFRTDINALRALSVVAVVGYHFRVPGFAAGFVGVDVFLVITGYLMTRKVLGDLALGRFSYPGFVAMRMRRIFPALAATIVACAIAGWFFTLPHEYRKHLLQSLSALTFVSNFVFDADNGYFAMAAQTKPLLHTWSLSVEWQFYIWMPLVLLLVWRWASARKAQTSAALLAILVALVLSLAWCLWTSQHDVLGSSYFSLRARAWEPLAGGLIAALEIRRRDSARAGLPWMENQAVAFAGWITVVVSIAAPLAESHWPGLLTIPPILGAAMIVAARKGARPASWLALTPVQRLGDWSYSIYLWHWPIWVFALGWLSLHGKTATAGDKALMAGLTLLVSAASYRYVEQPFRARPHFWTLPRLLAGSGALFAGLAGFTALAVLTEGFPDRLPDYLLPAELARKTNTPRDECFRNASSSKKAAETYCSFGADEARGRPSAMLWGDSFANQYLEPVSAAARDNGIHGLIATQSACRPFVDAEASNRDDPRPCRAFNRATLEFLAGHGQPAIVIVAGNWGSAQEIAGLVDGLRAADKIVVLILPLLNLGFDLPQRWIEQQMRAGKAIVEWKVDADPALTQAALRAEIAQRLSRYTDDPRLISVDPQSVICEAGSCYLVRNGEANFRDTAHISNVNAMQFRGLFDIAFKSAIRAQEAQKAGN
jgi:peptidoglycan/LPS O-acetylase OafA/YrhL